MSLLLLFLAGWLPQTTSVDASLRGLKAVSATEVWASGSKGTWLHSADAGRAWQSGVVPGAEALDFRCVEALAPGAAWLMSAGEGAKSRIYRTTDSGKSWQLLFTNPDPQGFFDSLRFWDKTHGILLGDQVEGRMAVFTTSDAGRTWERRATPPALPKEGAFAASNTSLALFGGSEVWFGTGGPAGARVFHSRDRGLTWTVATTPVRAGPAAGIFSLVFTSTRHGIAGGGDYTKPGEPAHNLAITDDGGLTWTEPPTHPAGYRSGLAFDPVRKMLLAVGTSGTDISRDAGRSWSPLDRESFNTAAFGASGKRVLCWAAGSAGRLAQLTP